MPSDSDAQLETLLQNYANKNLPLFARHIHTNAMQRCFHIWFNNRCEISKNQPQSGTSDGHVPATKIQFTISRCFLLLLNLVIIIRTQNCPLSSTIFFSHTYIIIQPNTIVNLKNLCSYLCARHNNNRMDVQLDSCPPTLLGTIMLQRVIML